MRRSCVVLLLFFIISLFTSTSSTLNNPKVVLGVEKDGGSGLHWAYLHKRTPLVNLPLLVDLNGNLVWLNCHSINNTFNSPICHSTQCSRANTLLCHNNTCSLPSLNPVTLQSAMSHLAQDQFQAQAHAPFIDLLFACAPSSLLRNGLPKNVQGVAGLGHNPISLPIQLASHFGIPHAFTMCLSPTPKSTGFISFGHQHQQQPNDIYLSYVPLRITHQGHYYVQATSIKVNNHVVVPLPLGAATIITTASPYTVLHHSIYQPLLRLYSTHFPNQAQVKAVAPFGLCFEGKKRMMSDMMVELKMENNNKEVWWRLSGDNLMVEAQPGIMCLGLLDGGLNPTAPIVIGARQLEGHLLFFDLANSRFGFSETTISCANFTTST